MTTGAKKNECLSWKRFVENWLDISPNSSAGIIQIRFQGVFSVSERADTPSDIGKYFTPLKVMSSGMFYIGRKNA